jgi:hypothetical protein
MIGIVKEIPFENLKSVERGFKNCKMVTAILDGTPMLMEKSNTEFIYWHGDEKFDNKSYELMNRLTDLVITEHKKKKK